MTSPVPIRNLSEMRLTVLRNSLFRQELICNRHQKQKMNKSFPAVASKRCARLSFCIAFLLLPETPHAASAVDLYSLSLEELTQVKVTTFSKHPERRFTSAGAVHVLTSEQIRRSGATSVPELLRMVPGVQVARINSNSWAIGVRGFASNLSRSLLVLIDGRSVYSPLFAGVYWDVQDLLVDDIDHIEVVLGPGGAIWGANAINGVINIITKDARTTENNLVSLGSGNNERLGAGLRVVNRSSPDTAWRAYAKTVEHGAMDSPGDDFDDWRLHRAGFRRDNAHDEGHLTLQGDIYDGSLGQRIDTAYLRPPFHDILLKNSGVSGGNLLGRWKSSDQANNWTLQSYLDHTYRDALQFEESRDTLDIDLQQNLRWNDQLLLLMGLGYRYTRDEISSIDAFQFDPQHKKDEVFSAFFQTDMTLKPEQLFLAVGSKFEHNEYSGNEAQPSIRLSWLPAENTTFWLATSQAVRTPSRVENDLTIYVLPDLSTPSIVRIAGNRSMNSEKVLSYESGIRTLVRPDLNAELSLFYNRYSDFVSIEPDTPYLDTLGAGTMFLVLPYHLGNGMRADTRGYELSMQWLPLSSLDISAHYALLNITAHPGNHSQDTTSEPTIADESPQHQFFTHIGWHEGQNEAGMDVRYVGELENSNIPAYWATDLTYLHKFSKQFEILFAGRNLFDNHHPEFANNDHFITELQRSIYLQANWRWQ